MISAEIPLTHPPGKSWRRTEKSSGSENRNIRPDYGVRCVIAGRLEDCVRRSPREWPSVLLKHHLNPNDGLIVVGQKPQ